MQLVETADGKQWWLCIFDDCGFCYPADWNEGEERLEELVQSRIGYLKILLSDSSCLA